ncbi:MAG: amino acid ABC transporter substrate-binding protein [Eubacterium sp.]|nr:amino acid ABC transporter substrate-binding protein [Eubacterium sp.]
MKKRLLSLLLGAAMVLSLAACGGSNAGTEESAASADASAEAEVSEDDDTTFVVGFDAEYPPYGYMDEDGEYVGFDLDLAEEVCARNGWTLVKQPIDWDSKDMELESGSIDCIWNGFTVTGREEDYTWTVPYVDNSIVFVVKADSDIESADDLAGKTVVVQADSSGLAALDENPDLTATFGALQQVADYNTAFLDLESGAVDCIVVDIGVAQYQLTSRGDTFRQLDEALTTEQYAVGFKLGNEELMETVQSTLFEMYEDGTIDEIASNYEDYNIPSMLCIGDYVE